jgi:hypothetical protein
MNLRIPRESMSSDAMKAVLRIDKTLNSFSPEERLPIAAECVVGALRELRLLGQKEPERQPGFDALRSELQAWLRQEIEALRFRKSQ